MRLRHVVLIPDETRIALSLSIDLNFSYKMSLAQGCMTKHKTGVLVLD